MASSPPPDSDRFFNQLMESMICPICKEKFKQPKVINCGHVYCQACLQEYINNYSRNYPPCPICRQNILPPTNDMPNAAASFPTQSVYQDIISQITEDSGDATGASTDRFGQCDLCMKYTTLEEKCLSCAYDMCSSCTLAHSKLSQMCTTIRMIETDGVPIADILAEQRHSCSYHSNTRSVVFCCTCKKYICEKCRLGEHLLHKAVDQEKFAKSCRKNMERMSERLKIFGNKTERAFDDLEKIKARFKESSNTEVDRINSTFDCAISALNEKRKEVLNAFNSRRKNIEARLDTQNEEYEKLRSLSQEIERKLKVILCGTSQGIFENLTLMKDKIDNLREHLFSILDDTFSIQISANISDTQPIFDFLEQFEYELCVSQSLCNQCNGDGGFITTSLDFNIRKYVSHFFDGKNFIVSLTNRNSMFNWSNIILRVHNGEVSRCETCTSTLWPYTFLEAKPSWEPERFLLGGVGCNEILEFNYDFEVTRVVKFELPMFSFFIYPLENECLLFFDLWRKQIICKNKENAVSFVIDHEHIKKKYTHILVSDNRRILLLGENQCLVLDLNGKVMTDIDIPKCLKLGNERCHAACGCLDSQNNIVTRIELGKDQTRSLWLFSADGDAERLILPTLPSGHTPEVSSACESVRGSLFVCADRVTKILRLGYLP